MRWRPFSLHRFVVRYLCADIHPSALKHGVDPDDIENAMRNALAVDDLDEDDLRLYIGPATDAALLEVISIERAGDEPELVIHAMPLRPKYRKLLTGE